MRKEQYSVKKMVITSSVKGSRTAHLKLIWLKYEGEFILGHLVICLIASGIVKACSMLGR